MPHKSQREPTSTKGRRHHNDEPRRHPDDHKSHRPKQPYHHRQSFAEDGWTGWRRYDEGWCSKARRDPDTGQWVCKVITPTYSDGIIVNTIEPIATHPPNTPPIPHAQQAYGPTDTPWPQQQQSWPPTPQPPPDPWSPSPTTRWEEPQPQAPTSPAAADQYAVPGQMPEQQKQQQEYENHPAADNASNVSHDAGSAAAARPKRREMRVSMGDDANTEILLFRDPRESGRVSFTVDDTDSSITFNTRRRRSGGSGGDDEGTRRTTTDQPPQRHGWSSGRSREGAYRSHYDG